MKTGTGDRAAGCAGLRLQEATDALNAFGEIYRKQALASGVIPQITGIFGICGGGLAIFPALTDFTFMADKGARLFVNSPNAIEDNYEEKCDTSSACIKARRLVWWMVSEVRKRSCRRFGHW